MRTLFARLLMIITLALPLLGSGSVLHAQEVYTTIRTVAPNGDVTYTIIYTDGRVMRVVIKAAAGMNA